MKTAESKRASVVRRTKINQPFFSRKAEGIFFGRHGIQPLPFFNPSSYSVNGDGILQTSLTIGQPNDKHEKEADATADKVVRRLATSEPLSKKEPTIQAKLLANSTTPLVQTRYAACEQEERLQKKEEVDQELMEEKIQRKSFFKGGEIPSNNTKNIYRKWSTSIESPLRASYREKNNIRRYCDPSISSCLDIPDNASVSVDENINMSLMSSGDGTFDSLFNQSSSSVQPDIHLPSVEANERKVLLQMEFKPTLDLLLSENREAETRLRRDNQNLLGTGGGIGILPGFSYGIRRQWGITSLGNRNALIEEVDRSGMALADVLHLVGLNNDNQIGLIPDHFISMFRTKAKSIAYFMLDQSEYLAEAEYERYTNIPTNQCTLVLPGLRASAKRLANFQYELVNLMNLTAEIFNADAPWGYPQGPTNISADDYYEYLGGSVFSTDSAVQSQLSNFRKAIQEEGLKFPVLMKAHLNYIKLGYEMTDEQLQSSVIGHAAEVLNNIRKSREDIDDDNIWDLEPVLRAIIELFNLQRNSYTYTYLMQYLNERKRNQSILAVFLGAVGLVLAIVATFATGGLAAFAIVGGAALGGYQTYQHFKRYNFEEAARGSSFDVNQSIGANFDPSFLSLAFDVAMTIVSFAQAASAIRGLRAVYGATNIAGRGSTAIERLGSNAGLLNFETNISRFAHAEGFIAERVSNDIIRLTHPSVEGEFILTRQTLRFQTPTGTGMRVEFEVPIGRNTSYQLGNDEFDDALNATFTGGQNEGIYQTTQRLVRGNLGERLATDALASRGHQILSFKPSILGTNQGGIDIVTIDSGIVFLIDNKALTRSGNIASVSALTTNFTRNLQTVRQELQSALLIQDISAMERGVLLQALNAIDNGNYIKAVTNANVARSNQILSGVTQNLQNKGIEFINVF